MTLDWSLIGQCQSISINKQLSIDVDWFPITDFNRSATPGNDQSAHLTTVLLLRVVRNASMHL